MPVEKVRESLMEEFNRRVNREGPTPTGHPEYDGLGPCWLWPTKSNYIFAPRWDRDRLWGQRRMLHYRVVYTLFNGTIPAGKIIRHRCDNGNCVNPEHLLMGTHADNTADMYRRNRKPVKLSVQAVAMMRDLVDEGCPPIALCRLVAEVAGMSVGPVKYRLYRSPASTIGRDGPNRVKAPDITTEELEAIKAVVIAGGGKVSLRAAIAEQAPGRQWEPIRHALNRDLGWDWKAWSDGIDATNAAKVVELYQAGTSVHQIYLTTGFGHLRQKRYLAEAGIEVERRYRGTAYEATTGQEAR